MNQREQLEAYEREQGIAQPKREAPVVGLQRTLAEVQRRLAIHVATRRAVLARIVESHAGEASIALGRLDDEMKQLNARERYLVGAIRRATAA